jgi:dethiobiotin synthetase
MSKITSNSRQGFFITGTDTEIGKTQVTAALTMGFRQQGYQVIPRKPIASGCLWHQGQLVSEDAQQLQQACQFDEPLEKICPYSFEPAISPARAIHQSGQNILLNDLHQACDASQPGLVLIEGAGGFLSPLTADGLNADLAQALGYPLILVVGNRLGCINHTLLTIEAIQRRQLTLHAIVVNDITPHADPANLQDLKALCTQSVFHYPYQDATMSPLFITL